MKKGIIIGIVIAVILIGGIFFYMSMNKSSSVNTNANPQTNNPANAPSKEITNNTPSAPVANTPSTSNVVIQNFAFNPSELTIKQGDTVIWTNKDSVPHTVTSDSGNELASSTLSNGATYSHTFNSAGTFDYHCSIHTMMKGKIIVQ